MTRKEPYVAIHTTADILEEPIATGRISRRESQLLLGEIFDVESRHGWFFKGKSRLDGYEGYVHFANIQPAEGKATHFVDNPVSIIHTGPDIKTRPHMTVSFMSRLEVEEGSLKNGFLRACGLGWVPESHVRPLTDLKKRIDHVSAALTLISVPYRYGGRSAMGIDCSALVQTALTRAGLTRIPRDADMQEKSERVGRKIDATILKRGDIVFFSQHVGIMIDKNNILSATEKFSGVVIEKLPDMIKRQGAITCVRRPSEPKIGQS